MIFLLRIATVFFQTDLLNHPDSSSLIGKKIKVILDNYNLTIEQVNVIQEPPMIFRGINFELSDSSSVFTFMLIIFYGKSFKK